MKERSRSSNELRPVPSDTCARVRPPARADPRCLALSPEFIHPIRALHTIMGRVFDNEEFYFPAISVLRFVLASIDRGSQCCVVCVWRIWARANDVNHIASLTLGDKCYRNIIK